MKLTSAAILMSLSFVSTLSQSSAALAQAEPAKPQATTSQPVGYWLAHGMEFTEIARIPEKEMPKRASDAIDALLEATP